MIENTPHIGRIVNIFSNRINRRLSKELAQYGITSVQAKIIGFLHREGQKRDVFQKNIEEELDIRRSSVTSVLQLMEKNGYIIRISDVKDARLKKILLTEKGHLTWEKIYTCILDFEKYLEDQMSEEEKNTLISVINRLSNKIMD